MGHTQVTVRAYSMYRRTARGRDLCAGPACARLCDSGAAGPAHTGVRTMVAGIVSEGSQVTVDVLWEALSRMREQGAGGRPLALGGVDRPLPSGHDGRAGRDALVGLR